MKSKVLVLFLIVVCYSCNNNTSVNPDQKEIIQNEMFVSSIKEEYKRNIKDKALNFLGISPKWGQFVILNESENSKIYEFGFEKSYEAVTENSNFRDFRLIVTEYDSGFKMKIMSIIVFKDYFEKHGSFDKITYDNYHHMDGYIIIKSLNGEFLEGFELQDGQRNSEIQDYFFRGNGDGTVDKMMKTAYISACSLITWRQDCWFQNGIFLDCGAWYIVSVESFPCNQGGGDSYNGSNHYSYPQNGEFYESGGGSISSYSDKVHIPGNIILTNGKTVKVIFGIMQNGLSTDQLVDKCILNALTYTLNYVNNQGYDINSIFINSSVRNFQVQGQTYTDATNSNHWFTRQNAIDISMINETAVSNMGCNPLTDAFQDGLELYNKIWENYGPCFEHKGGSTANPGADHSNHFHISALGTC